MHPMQGRRSAAHVAGSPALSRPGSNLGIARRDAAHRAQVQVQEFWRGVALCAKGGELAEAEGHHPDISFGWGHATVSLQTKKIKGLHENDFILAAKIDRLLDGARAS